MSTPVLEMRGISKFFPGIRAVEAVDFSLAEGEVHALVGENGAGKSTMVKLLTGIYRPSAGEMLVAGKPVYFKTPNDARIAGIAAIHQEAVMFQDLSITENIFMGHQKRNRLFGLLDNKGMQDRAKELLDRVGLSRSPKTLIRELSIAERHMVEIAKALSVDAKIVIMDEPTSALSLKEVHELFLIVRQLRDEGKTILFISHKFEEVFEIAQSYTVLRDGKNAGKGRLADATVSDLVKMMVGRNVDQLFSRTGVSTSETALEVSALCRNGVFRDISFELKKGEILGFFGLVGSGRSEVMNSLVGIDPRDSGDVRIKGKTVRLDNMRDAIKHKIAYVPEDRQSQGALLGMNIRENIGLPSIDGLSVASWIKSKFEKTWAKEHGDRFEIKAANYEHKVHTLSGGNQQKVVLAKWMATEPEILILDEPTKGIDIATKWAVYQYIRAMAEKGMAIILVSSELQEIIGLSDRVAVMHEGSIRAMFTREEAHAEAVVHAAFGADGGGGDRALSPESERG